MTRSHLWTAVSIIALSLGACSLPHGSSDALVGFGPNPNLPAPKTAWIPLVGVPRVVHWAAGAAPKAPPGFTVTRYAEGLDHPRWLYKLPNGDVLVAESADEPHPADKSTAGIRGFFQNLLMRNVGAVGKSSNKLILLRDANNDGISDGNQVFARGLTRPFGITLAGSNLYVANDNGVVSFPYVDGQTEAPGVGAKVFDLPGGDINHHWTKNVVTSPDGTKLYATVGSNSNIGDMGMQNEVGRAAIWEHDLATGKTRLFATGIRNPNGIDFEPSTSGMWTVSNERDEIGADLPPDYFTSVKDGGFYGWPYSYYGQHVDDRVKPQNPELVAKAISPDYAVGPHTGTLGLTFYKADAFPAQYRGGAFIGQHGSWNRKPLNGYRVIFVPFAGGRPQMPAQIFLDGFLDAKNQIQGRPVAVIVDKTGALLVADDVGGIIWRVAPVAGGAPAPGAAAD